jgi:multidrug efflux pump subunit AcrB
MIDELRPEEKRGPIAWMAGHSVASNLIMLLCLVGGYMALGNVKQELFPDITQDAVRISVVYPAASPSEVESGIVLAVEEAVRGVDGVDEVTSAAKEGFASVTVELLLGVDPQKAAQDIKSEVDRITTLPIDAEEPEVRVVVMRRQVLSLALYGDVSDAVLHELAESTWDRLNNDPDITYVEVAGLPDLEIAISITQENLRRYGLTMDDVAARLRAATVDVPGGAIKTGSGEILMRVKERRDYGRQFAELPIIITPDGTEVRLGQIATVDDSFADADRYVTFNGKPAVMLDVFRVGDQTPIQVADAVQRHLVALNESLPPGVQAGIHADRSEGYRQRVRLLLKNGAMGLVLVLITLGLFLEVRLAFWVMMGIPVSFLGSFLLLPTLGVSINMISLFAYIIAIGIVVDDAIVIGENIYHYHQEGMSFPNAAVRGAREVAMPVTFSILTNIATFLPLYFIPGPMGNIFKMIPLVVCTVFLISLAECLFVLPMHLSHQRDRERRGVFAWLHRRQNAFSHGFTRWVRESYGPFLKFTLRHRYVTVTFAASLLTVMVAYAASGRMGFSLFPVVEADRSEAKLVLPYGSPVAKTEAVMQRLIKGARSVAADSGHPELITEIVADVGRGGSHIGGVRVGLAKPKIRDKIMTTEEFTTLWRKAVGQVAGVEALRFISDAGGPGSHGRPLDVELSHTDIGVLEAASAELAAIVSEYPIVKDVNDGFQPGKPQLDFAIKPNGKSLKLTALMIARQVRGAFYGSEVLRQQRGRNEIKIIVRLPKQDRSSEHAIEELMIRTPAGTYVPLREVAAVKRGRAYTTIDRRNGRRVIHVTSDVTPRSRANEVIADLQATALADFRARHDGLRVGFEGHQADMRESLGSLKLTFALAMLAVYAMLAIPFRSYSQPLIVMASIPFGIVGALLGHLIMGYDLCLPSMFGIVALSGVVVNDALIMIDFANRREREDHDLTHHDAIHSAAIQRFRPILLTTLTTFGGLAPMIFETSRQARFMIPMALSLGFGLVFATLITLVLVPSLYLLIDDGKRSVGRLRRFLFPRV